MKFTQEVFAFMQDKAAGRRRGRPGQAARREVERTVRMAVVAFDRCLTRQGVKQQQVAHFLDLSPRTLRAWNRSWETDQLRSGTRGCPARRSPLETRNLVVLTLKFLGPELGVTPLQAMFPEMARREVQDMVRRYRALYRRQNSITVHELHWPSPRRVWAADHVHPPAPIDGLDPRAFGLRDLSSHKQLAWEGVADETSGPVREILEARFIQHGAPLVLKADNGGAFIDMEFKAFLDRWSVFLHLSPPRQPSYNGSCEAGGGSMKRRTRAAAAVSGRLGRWTSDDMEAARLQANQTARPWGILGETPDEAWDRGESIPQEERDLFAVVVRKWQEVSRTRAGCTSEETPLKLSQRAPLDRWAIVEALKECRYLFIRRKVISTPIKSKKVAGIA